jgi:hypothetical protein
MHANIDGLQTHPLNPNKSLPILTSPTDKNIPTTETKVRDYFYKQNSYSLIPGTRNKPKAPPQKVGDDGQFQFDENRQYVGPDRITGVMSVSAPGNVKQAMGDLLIKLEGDAHQIKYKPTQRKNNKAKKMFPGVPAGLCSEGLMRSIRLVTGSRIPRRHCAMLRSSRSSPIWIVITSLLLTEFKKNGCKIFVIEYDPIDYRRMAPAWDLFINFGDMADILGIRVKVQVIPPPGEWDPNSIT